MTDCHQLELTAADGKQHTKDVANADARCQRHSPNPRKVEPPRASAQTLHPGPPLPRPQHHRLQHLPGFDAGEVLPVVRGEIGDARAQVRAGIPDDGIAEAVKVAAIKDAEFFRLIERSARKIHQRDLPTIRRILQRCALLHLDHIATSGDPYELGAARPLDYGHWAAHKLELLSKHRLSHGHAVAIGIALDAFYAARVGLLPQKEADRLVALLRACGLPTFAPELSRTDRRGRLAVLAGLEDFRAHLGGELAVTLPAPFGSRREIHAVDPARMAECISALAARK